MVCLHRYIKAEAGWGQSIYTPVSRMRGDQEHAEAQRLGAGLGGSQPSGRSLGKDGIRKGTPNADEVSGVQE